MDISFSKKFTSDQLTIRTKVFTNEEMDHTVAAHRAIVDAPLKLVSEHGFDLIIKFGECAL